MTETIKSTNKKVVIELARPEENANVPESPVQTKFQYFKNAVKKYGRKNKFWASLVIILLSMLVTITVTSQVFFINDSRQQIKIERDGGSMTSSHYYSATNSKKDVFPTFQEMFPEENTTTVKPANISVEKITDPPSTENITEIVTTPAPEVTSVTNNLASLSLYALRYLQRCCRRKTCPEVDCENVPK